MSAVDVEADSDGGGAIPRTKDTALQSSLAHADSWFTVLHSVHLARLHILSHSQDRTWILGLVDRLSMVSDVAFSQYATLLSKKARPSSNKPVA